MKVPEKEFARAVDAFRKGDLETAKQLAGRMLKKKILVADTAHLLALIAKQEGKFQSARKHFETSLAANPRQGSVLSNYANLLSQYRQHTEADDHYRRATSLDPTLSDAWHNWAILLNAQERFEEADYAITRAIKLNPIDARFLVVKAVAQRGLEDYQGSIDALDRATALTPLGNPMRDTIIQQKAVTLRAQGDPARSIESLNVLIERGDANPETRFLKAGAHYDAGEFAKAEAELQKAIEAKPDHVNAHEALNKLYWEQGDREKFLQSYDRAIATMPDSIALRYSLASQLIGANRTDDAVIVLRTALDEIGPDGTLLHALGALTIRSGRLDDADKLIELALASNPGSTRFLIDKANLLIRQQDYAAALTYLERGSTIEPLDQEIWAYKGLCWRLNGDDKARWLFDYDTLVDIDYLDVPPGYDNLEHFLHELRGVLTALHSTNHQPLDQSVRNGTQTVGKLLAVNDTVIQDYRRVLSDSIQRYVECLPVDPAHPFLNRNRQRVVHAGSWSVKLNSGGYHTNHMHPQGWLSNCTYVSVPDAVGEADEQRSGWLRFGQTSLELGAREEVSKAICPREGMRVLFPSYMWHGTYPFESRNVRMTLPSDILPRR